MNNSIAVFDVSCVEVANVIHSLKNSSAGHDEFPIFVGKQCVDSFIDLMTFLINFSLFNIIKKYNFCLKYHHIVSNNSFKNVGKIR